MARDVFQIEPTELRRRDPADALRARFGGLAEVRMPNEAEEPILAPTVRAAVFEWLSELAGRDDLAAVGVKPRSTALLYGPPGTGKTTIAHHLAARLGLPLVIVGAENITGSLLGESEKNVAALFEKLKGTKAVVLIDEIDAIGMRRADVEGSSAGQARASTLTVLLRKIEAFEGFLVGATNRQGSIDEALWRRFHLQLSVDLPGGDERYAILKRYGAPFVFADDDVDLLTDLTEGASPALLRGLMEGIKRALVLGRRLGWRVDDPTEVVLRVIAGLSPPPELPAPPLWAEDDAVDRLVGMTWPPRKEV